MDSSNIRWSCVEAYSMQNSETAKKASELSATENGKVTVVCTPSGGAKTVRLELSETWENELKDDDLIEKITAASNS